MADEFPTEFDVIVIGTGLSESILAAAFSRIGQKVLHIDRNGYYSGRWCSFNLQAVGSWINQTKGEDALKSTDSDTVKSLISDEESTIELELTDKSYSHTNVTFNVGDDKTDEESDLKEKVSSEDTSNSQCNEKENAEISEKADLNDSQEFKHADSVAADNSSGASEQNKNNTKDTSQKDSVNTDVKDNVTTDVKDSATTDIKDSSTTDVKGSSTTDVKDSSTTDVKDSCLKSSDSKIIGEKKELPESVVNPDIKKNTEKWTKSRLLKEWRKFNLDLTPKLLYCGGSMVQLLITSDIAKYCEFKTVTRMLTLLDGKLEKVPCSRADVFNSKEVSMLEKRMLMKFLTSCAEYDKRPTDYEAFTDRPFTDYLESKKLTKNIKHFVQHSIAMATSETLTPEGLAKTKKFLHSLGRYGNTAFLWPLYGCGELPQGFCRMCAVFGGVYCLKLSASHLVVDKDNKCTGVISTDGKKLTAKYVIIEESSVPVSLFNASNKRYISRVVLVTDRSILHDDSQQLSLLQIPNSDGRYLTTVIELPPSSMSSPSPLNVVHITMETENGDTTPELDLQDIVKTLFQIEPSQDDGKPVIMWSMFFKREFYCDVTVDRTVVPENVIVIPGPGPQLDLDIVVDQSRDIFENLMPGEDFLPRPPNPEDIIYIDDAEKTVKDESNKSDFTESKSDQSESIHKPNDQSQSDNSDITESKSDQSESINKPNDQSQSDNLEVIESKSDKCESINKPSDQLQSDSSNFKESKLDQSESINNQNDQLQANNESQTGSTDHTEDLLHKGIINKNEVINPSTDKTEQEKE
ncbi:rab proteins geranylgeranyltransferase component A-like [Mytilus californianus]|uniref:rab proteins geranylgeranyltransferase component A-like n=1 Tax=Mytilus californianus TaxID=6549 RepID=UPI002247AF4B|nr:rab proteins geranylgeranyltransferase component A-like [Mytilus californianus]